MSSHPSWLSLHRVDLFSRYGISSLGSNPPLLCLCRPLESEVLALVHFRILALQLTLCVEAWQLACAADRVCSRLPVSSGNGGTRQMN